MYLANETRSFCTDLLMFDVRRLQWVGLCLLLFTSSEGALAACNFFAPGTPGNLNIPLRVNNITVGRDVPIGTQVYRQDVQVVSGIKQVNCVAGTRGAQIARELRAFAGPVSVGHSGAGRTVYATSVPGLGVQFLDAENRTLPSTSNLPDCPESKNCEVPLREHLKFSLSFIKTSNSVGSGAVSGIDLPSVAFSHIAHDKRMVLQNVGFSGLFRVVAQTCVTPNIQVDLRTNTLRDLETAGFTPWKNFNIVLRHCPAFHGYYPERNTLVENLPQPNKIAFQVNPTRPAISIPDGVLQLNESSQASMATAQGIGLQLAWDNGQPLMLTTMNDSGVHLEANEGGEYVIRLKARYLKTASGPAQAGPANATATFTINYQ